MGVKIIHGIKEPELQDPLDWPEELRKKYSLRTLASYSRKLNTDIEIALNWFDRAKEVGMWEWAEQPDFQSFVSTYGVGEGALDEYKYIVDKIRDGGYEGKITGTQVKKTRKELGIDISLNAEASKNVGRPKLGHEGKKNVGNTNNKSTNNGIDYIAKRLKRDNPEILAEVQSGKISLNKAAIKAGFRKKMVSVELSPEGFINAMKKQFNKDQINKIIVGLTTPAT